ncbi:ATPase, T2SS/T4P/T4SS family [Pelistega ratti]|uniref:ATPase, T2SS/T4P/T4SS family n=1 Tax=Pelistega ratti TaxID=2652177 RepID=UPI00135A4ABB|nr:ATPase, T2SS/T4P/T4SS family [Pelistega ratti]
MQVEIRFEDGTVQYENICFPYHIGRTKEMQLVIRSWRIGKHHASIIMKEGEVFIEDFGSLAGTLLNGERIHLGGPLKVGDEIIMGPCLMIIKSIHDPISIPVETAPLLSTDELQEHHNVNQTVKEDCLRERELYHRQRLHALLLEALDLRRRDIASMSDQVLRAEVDSLLRKIIDDDTEIGLSFDKEVLRQQVLDEAVGLGPLEPLLKDATVTEIMVNRFDEIYVEKKGLLEKTDTIFSSEKAVIGVIDRIVAPIGRRIDESSPMVDARLLDGSRVNAVIPPIAIKGASITIRKFAQHRPKMQELIQLDSLDEAMATFLNLCVKHRMNMIVSGGTGSGKTTLLNILSNCIPENERLVTIEDAAELKLNHAHLVCLEARPANVEGKGMVSIRDLVRNALRMRPDRIIVGECRGAEAFDTLVAMNTGHAGSLTTLHANSTRDALSRLETMIMMANMDLPLSAIREHIASSIHFIVQQTRLSNGRRVIASIAEVDGLESGVIKTQELFHYDRKGAFVGRGIMPHHFEVLKQSGIEQISPELFNQYTPIKQATTAML